MKNVPTTQKNDITQDTELAWPEANQFNSFLFYYFSCIPIPQGINER